MYKALTLMSCISTLLLSGFSHVSALNIPTRVGYSMSDPFYENVDLEYYAYGYSGGSQSFTVTLDGNPTFTVDDLLINGSTSYYNSAGNVILTSDLTLNNEPFNVEGTVDLSDLEVSVESDGTSQGSIYNRYTYTYTKVQRIAVTFSGPAQGYIKLTPGTSGTTEDGWSYRVVSGCSVNISTADSSTRTMTIRPAGNTVCVIDIYKTYTSASSITTNRFFGIQNASFDDGSHLEAYEVPVSDDSAHSWLQQIFNVLNQDNQSLDEKGEDLTDTAETLTGYQDSIHTIETSLGDNLDTTLNQLPSDTSILTNLTDFTYTAQWIGRRLEYFATYNPYLNAILVFPLIIGLALAVIGRWKR